MRQDTLGWSWAAGHPRPRMCGVELYAKNTHGQSYAARHPRAGAVRLDTHAWGCAAAMLPLELCGSGRAAGDDG